jgi:L-fuconolactonase
MTRRDFAALTAVASIRNMPASPQYRIIDPHVHIWTHNPKYPWAKETTTPPSNEASVEMLMELMKENGVERTVLVQYIGYRWDNSYVADTLKRFPKIFQGVSRVNPLDPASPDHLTRLVEQGFKGVRISPGADAGGDWIRGALMPPLWKRAEDLHQPMVILTSITRMPDLQPLIERHPALTVVIDHMGDCPTDQPHELDKLIALAHYPKVFVKISHSWSLSKQAYPWADTFEHVKRLHAAFGPQRLMWGTDWPVCLAHGSYKQSLTVVRDEMKFLNYDDRSWILSKTIERIWPFPA